jgi:hypothetical protein
MVLYMGASDDLAIPHLGWVSQTIAFSSRYSARIYPVLKVIAWGIWMGFAAWVLYGLSGRLERKTFYGINGILWGLMGGTNLLHSWVRRRVDPGSVKTYEGWWPTPKDLPEAKPDKNL